MDLNNLTLYGKGVVGGNFKIEAGSYFAQKALSGAGLNPFQFTERSVSPVWVIGPILILTIGHRWWIQE